MNKAPVVSVIIPVYNAEKFLRRCVNSVLNQEYKDLEIILVNDCSNDSSKDICEELQKAHINITTLHHRQNRGAAAARNSGLKIARGNYIIFVDSDDYWTDQVYLTKYIAILEDNKEINFIVCGLFTYYPNTNKYIKSVAYPEVAVAPSSKSIDKQKALLKIGSFPNSPCNKIISKEFLLKHNLFFREGYTGEDILWYLQMTKHANNFVCINDYYYVYDQGNDNSVTKRKGSISLLKIVVELSDKYRYDTSEFAVVLLGYMAYEYLLLLTDLNYFSEKEKNTILEYDWLRKYDTNKKVRLANLFISIFGKKNAVRLMNYYKSKVRKRFYIA
ncbi:glycosyltransferase family 2 protein [Porphyromonas levii]|uniref:glycosyltransferase family 2 protein n=1 Tax=Porphyromonas levii TaxID=28114 RepID=UPI000370A735|nr:glycosyltransferase family 2 protein [Porphyromonas levii]